MSTNLEKTVFISYRRTNTPWALAIYKDLTAKGYDVFFDYESIKSGDFEQIIFQNIMGRAHFVVILTPSALERCNEPGDWLRREIELALDKKRNIVPLLLDGFSFNSPSVSSYLTGKLELLKRYNGLTIPAEYFDAAMTRLREERLNVPLDAVLHPISDAVQEEVERQRVAVGKESNVSDNELIAQEWFEKGNKFVLESNNYKEAVFFFSEAIKLDSNHAEFFYNRGLAKQGMIPPVVSKTAEDIYDDIIGAIEDYSEAIKINPEMYQAYNNRGLLRIDRGDLFGAEMDFTAALRIKPDYVHGHVGYGNLYLAKKDFDNAIRSFTKAINLEPNLYMGWFNRGMAYGRKLDLQNAINDFSEVIRLKPDLADAYHSRGMARTMKGDILGGISDMTKAKILRS